MTEIETACHEAYVRLEAWCDLWKETGGLESDTHWVKQARDILAKALEKKDKE